jgi:hypothetical protein
MRRCIRITERRATRTNPVNCTGSDGPDAGQTEVAVAILVFTSVIRIDGRSVY